MCRCANYYVPMGGHMMTTGFIVVSETTKDAHGCMNLNPNYMRNYNNNPIVKLTFEFALSIVEFSDFLIEKKRFAIADQVLRSGCSIGANVREAQGAESKADFIHKMKVAFKEAEETEYWLESCELAKNCPKPGARLQKIEEILKVLTKIIFTSKGR
jgi:four helix bundle protein